MDTWTYTWNGAESANDVKGLPAWLHEFLIGWSGLNLYLSTDEGEHTVEIGDTVECMLVGECNSSKECITVRKP